MGEVPARCPPVTAETATDPPALPSVPMAGLEEVLSSFSGAGGIFNAVAELAGDSSDWSAEAVRMRSNRVLFTVLEPLIARWPAHSSDWIDALPAQSERRREIGAAPYGRVDWVKTRISGWPPERFHTIVRERRPDSVLTEAFAWTVGTIVEIANDARRVVAEIERPVREQLLAAQAVWAGFGPIDGEDNPPGRPELTALRASGHPWNILADVADVIQKRRANATELARETLLPDPELRGVLFHLGCIGEVLLTLRDNGWDTRSVRPIGIGRGPAFRATGADGALDIWYEVGAAFRYYGSRSPYSIATAGLGEGGRPIGADIGIFDGRGSALLFECKCSLDRQYVLRNGYEQALAYLAECRSVLVDSAAAVVVGPDETVRRVGSTTTAVGSISILPASAIADRLRAWLAGDGGRRHTASANAPPTAPTNWT